MLVRQLRPVACGVLTSLVPHRFEDDNDELPREWDPARLEAYWQKRPFACASRAAEICYELFPLATRIYFSKKEESFAVEVKDALTRLGPAFIKLGQAVSIRPDLLPAEYLKELQKLCDAVPEFPTSIALKTVEEEVGVKIFEGLDETSRPIAAASLGQCYRCRLDGRDVAVKVQRPDMATKMSLDLTLVRWWASFVQRMKATFTKHRPYDVALAEAFGRGAWGELDYQVEAENQTRMAEGVRNSKFRRKVAIPTVRLASRKVLVTDWVDGDKLSEASPKDIKRLCGVGVDFFLWQLLEFGHYHCDPHAGNLFIDRKGRLVLIDFGLCCEVASPDSRKIGDALVSLVRRDLPGLLDAAIALDFLPEDTDREVLLPVLKKVFDKTHLSTRAMKRAHFAAISDELNQIFFEYPFHVPDFFAHVTRAIIILEGIALTGDPTFDLFQAAYPHAAHFILFNKK